MKFQFSERNAFACALSVLDTDVLHCPKCRTGHAHHSHRRGPVERVARLVGFRAFRCHQCQHRFLRFTVARKSESAPVHDGSSKAEAEVRATRDAIGRKRKRREMLLYGFGLLLFVAFLYYLIRDRGSGTSGE